ncbi:MAG: uncharacterized protein JWN95_2135 [Frankiales bacterium]|nr:uncharacterized protein [Frankiales bacterium]
MIADELLVTGGSHGSTIAVDLDRLGQLATQLDGVCFGLAEAVGLAARTGAAVALATATALDPIGAAQVAALAAVSFAVAASCATDGELLAIALREAVLGYRAADELGRATRPVGRALIALPAAAMTATQELRAVAARRESPGLAAARVYASDPALAALAEDVIGPVPLTSSVLGQLYRPGRARVQPIGAPTITGSPPRGTADLLRGLARRDQATTGGGIDIRTVAKGGRITGAIIDLPGTKDWGLPGGLDPNVADLGSNLRLLGGRPNTYQQGVLEAVRQSGLPLGTPIMLVGHSQGGMVAARSAASLTHAGYPVSHVMTAGAPIGQIGIPASTRLLALEAVNDPIPELDAMDNVSRPNVITARFDQLDRATLTRHPLARHDLRESYLPGAELVDRSDNADLRDWMRSAAPFLGGDQLHVQAFQIDRRP